MRRLTFLVELLERGVDGAGEMSGALERVMGEMVPLEVAPGALDVVQ